MTLPLTRCASCGQPMSDSASACPHCGEPVRPLYAVPEYARPPQRSAGLSSSPLLETDAESPATNTPEVAELAAQLAAIEGLTRQELVNLIAWRAHALEVAQRRTRTKTQPGKAARASTGRTKTPRQTRNHPVSITTPLLIISMTVVTFIFMFTPGLHLPTWGRIVVMVAFWLGIVFLTRFVNRPRE